MKENRKTFLITRKKYYRYVTRGSAPMFGVNSVELNSAIRFGTV
jgi:hypothetical protein